MSLWRLVWRSVVYDRRSLLATLLGAALAAMALVGSLIIGDSVRYTLRQQAQWRIGAVDRAMSTGDRLIRAELADTVAADAPQSSIAPVLQLQGIAATADGGRRALDVAVLGVDERFFAMAPTPARIDLHPGRVWLNAALAAQLSAATGDTIVVRVNKPTALSRDLTFATTDDAVLALRVEVAGVVDDEQFGRFSLAANQQPPFNAFVPLDWLGQQSAQFGRANLLLQSDGMPAPTGDQLAAAVASSWSIDDLSLATRSSATDGTLEWRSSRVFLDDEVADAAARLEPEAIGLLTYFVNEIRRADRSTPYSTITGIGPLNEGAALPQAWQPIIPADLKADEIVIPRWLADDLRASVGDRLDVRYFELAAGRTLREASSTFAVRAIIESTGPAADAQLMPDIPGLTDSADCRDWNPGVPIDLDRIRDKDEQYWDEHRGTPKAFISLDAARALWSNRFGSLTAIRTPAAQQGRLAPAALLANLNPQHFGLTFQPVRTAALAAANPTTDFGGLFIGLSLFLIVAALLLTGMLFAFTVDQRRRQMGTLLAVGWSGWMVRGWLLREAILVAASGSVAGALLAVAYSRALLAALQGMWKGAVASAALDLHVTWMTLAIGAVISFVAAMIAMHLAARRLLRQHAVDLLSGKPDDRAVFGASARRWLLPAAATLCLVAGLGCIAWAAAGEQGAAIAAFFTSGTLLLIAGVLASRWVLTRLVLQGDEARLTPRLLALRSAARRPGRSTATIALLASGCFLVVAVGLNRLPTPDPASRSSGTGGFALLGQSSIALLADLNTPEARQAANLDAELFRDVSFVPLRIRAGDEASCLNLNRAQQPRVLGVNPDLLAQRDAFTFASTLNEPAGPSPWMLLSESGGEGGVIPAIVDQASMMWAMHRSLGDVITYQNAQGDTVKLQLVASLANSILQGNLIISESNFERAFPSEAGHRMLLIDCPPDKADAVSQALMRAFADIGLQITPTAQRLAEFNAVQNTYMAVFQVLGGLGVIVGTAGLGMVLVRNVSERRGELALLAAVGFVPRQVRRLLLIEHAALLALGLGVGVIAAVPAVWPALAQSGSPASLGVTLLIVILIAATGAASVVLATHWATRGRLMDSLRRE
ncbi:MAG: FtsX-like permease family protein [Phycisphaerales bacterium]|nr:FtsX-like permease family protein [Phycisphaerales bacterium]